MQLVWGAATDTGAVRDVNQDAVLAGPAVFAVADGMGGHAAGDVASSLVVSALATVGAAALTSDGVVEALVTAHRRIREEANLIGATDGMGTTLAAITRLDDQASTLLLVNIGDSRVYRWADGDAGLVQLTTDHSVVAELIAEGSLAPEDAEQHPERNVITRALGVGEHPDLEVLTVAASPGDRFVVCSDGLYRVVDDETIVRTLEANPAAPDAASALLAVALARHADDNVSVIVVEVRSGDGGQDTGSDATRPREAA